MVGPAGF